ncbi:MAG: hypothetical protein L6Q59_16800 [Ignavibacteriaceae bacterium]|nr:hypothetical protein [Ignavibacteriaceae bacterium]
MKPKQLIVFAALLLFTGCRQKYVEYNFVLDLPQTVYVGEAIFSATVGKTTEELTYLDPKHVTELVYLGKSNNTIKIGYVEYEHIYFDKYIRPAFGRVLEYDLSQSDTIGYNLTRIKVINSTNSEITYKVLTTAAEGYMADTVLYKDFVILHKPVLRK